MIRLPIDDFIEPIRSAIDDARAAVVVAAPGAGKTTRVPPSFVGDGRVILLQPRRVAARAIAARIAGERGWTLGREVGWQIRQDRRFSHDTGLLVVTEGILTARLQTDPLLSDFRTIVIDEFHERSIHADLAIALAKQAWQARGDLRIVVMSATLDATSVASYLGNCPIVDVPGRLFSLEISYAAGQSVAAAAVDLLHATSGQVLCFLPGAAEIGRTVTEISAQVAREASAARPIEIVPLHGSLDGADQDRAIHPSHNRRVIVATNIAETSLTVPGVTAVVDSGLHKVARYDADRAIDTLVTERVTMDAADQRAGRAGRLAPGVVRRLWDARDRLRPHREPEIHRIDLSAAVLDVIAWGGDPRTLDWFEAPKPASIDAALALLTRLGLIAAGPQDPPAVGRPGPLGSVLRLTTIGRQAQQIPMHPRLARIVVAARQIESEALSRAVEQACEFLADGRRLPPRSVSTTSDLLAVVDSADRGLRIAESDFRRAIFAGFPDRVAKRRAPGSPNVLLSSGTGAVIGRESGVIDAEFIVAIDVTNGVVRIASAVDREWLEPTSIETTHRFDAASGTVKAAQLKKYDAIVLSEHATAPDPAVAASLLADAWLARGPGRADRQLMHRLTFAGLDVDIADAIRTAAYGARAIDELTLAGALAANVRREIDRLAPETIDGPSRRRIRLEYGEDGSVSASVKLQELFGLAETPRIGPRREPIVFALLAPNGRPVQVTRDLHSFWDRTYPEVRKELRGRYPKHAWPENPWKVESQKSKGRS
jgi:ATP-dependent helicase HrpB